MGLVIVARDVEVGASVVVTGAVEAIAVGAEDASSVSLGVARGVEEAG